jgi:anti-sigma factor RsiW
MAETEQPDDPVRDEIVAFLDGELNDDEAGRIESQLNRDPKLRAEADALKQAWDFLDYLPRPEPSPDFASRTMTRLPTPAPPAPASSTHSLTLPARVRRPWFRIAAAAAAGAFLVWLGYIAGGSMKSNSHTLPEDIDERIARDARILENLPLYRYSNDLEFVQSIEELFGHDTNAN